VARYSVVALGVVAALVCGRLGLWQLDRLGQRRGLNAGVAAGLAQPAVSPEVVWGAAQGTAHDLDFRRARLAGRFDFEREVIVVGRTLGGVPGVHLVTPLVQAGGGGAAILVERGWAGSPDGRSVNLTALHEPADAEVAGVLVVPRGGGATHSEGWPIRVRAADPGFLGPRYPYPLVPLILRRDSATAASLRPVPLPELTDGPHVSYAIQWFAFGTIALVGSVVLFRSSGRPGREPISDQQIS